MVLASDWAKVAVSPVQYAFTASKGDVYHVIKRGSPTGRIS